MVQTTMKAELIFSGRTLERNAAWEPNGNIRQKGIEKAYCDARGYNAYKSEERKKAILAEISSIRTEMKGIVMSTQRTSATCVKRPLPAKANAALTTLENIGKFVEGVFTTAKKHIQLNSIRNYTISN